MNIQFYIEIIDYNKPKKYKKKNLNFHVELIIRREGIFWLCVYFVCYLWSKEDNFRKLISIFFHSCLFVGWFNKLML